MYLFDRILNSKSCRINWQLYRCRVCKNSTEHNQYVNELQMRAMVVTQTKNKSEAKLNPTRRHNSERNKTKHISIIKQRLSKWIKWSKASKQQQKRQWTATTTTTANTTRTTLFFGVFWFYLPIHQAGGNGFFLFYLQFYNLHKNEDDFE